MAKHDDKAVVWAVELLTQKRKPHAERVFSSVITETKPRYARVVYYSTSFGCPVRAVRFVEAEEVPDGKA